MGRLKDWWNDYRVRRALRPLGITKQNVAGLQVTPQLRLYDAYTQVREILKNAGDPASVELLGPEAERAQEAGGGMYAGPWFRGGLRALYATGDELAAFGLFAEELEVQGRALGWGPDQLAQQANDLAMVRSYLAK